jgi:hypothetical protein
VVDPSWLPLVTLGEWSRAPMILGDRQRRSRHIEGSPRPLPISE